MSLLKMWNLNSYYKLYIQLALQRDLKKSTFRVFMARKIYQAMIWNISISKLSKIISLISSHIALNITKLNMYTYKKKINILPSNSFANV